MAVVTEKFYSLLAEWLTEHGHAVKDTPEWHATCDGWQIAEGGPGRHNPFNTTLRLPGSVGFGSNVPQVQHYQSQAQGVQATGETLIDPRHSDLLAAIVAGHSPYYVAVELDRAKAGQSAWGTDGWTMSQVLHDRGLAD